MRKHKKPAKTIANRRARHDYALGDLYNVGLVLTGAETKALRQGQGSLQGAYVTIKDTAKSAKGGGELWLVNALIMGGKGLTISETEQTRSRKLLAKRREINQLISAKQQGLTIVPLEILTGGRYIKLKIAAARGKKQYDKRETLKRRAADRRIEAELKTKR